MQCPYMIKEQNNFAAATDLIVLLKHILEQVQRTKQDGGKYEIISKVGFVNYKMRF